MNKTGKRLGAMLLTGAMMAGMAVGASAATYVAKIGSTGYTTLNAALDAVKSGQTIVLQTNVYSSNERYYDGLANGVAYIYEENAAKSFTIDFNGKTIYADTSTEDGMLIGAESTAGDLSITLKNGAISAAGANVDGICVMDLNADTPTRITLDNMTVTADGEAGINCLNAKLYLKANITGLDDAVYAEDSNIHLTAGQFTATGTDSGDGAIVSYKSVSEDTLEPDMDKIFMPEAPAVVRPADWETNPSTSISVVNYDDVKLKDASVPNPWFYYYVYDMAEVGIVSGDGNLWTFHPYNNVTREQFAQILASASGADLSVYEGKTSFSDVKTTRWSAKAIEWAYQNGIVSGTGDGKYSPYANITRQEVCVMLNKYQANIMKLDVQQKVEVATYPDSSKVASWAQEAVQNMLVQGVISGTKQSDGTIVIDPKGNTTRAQICTMMSAMLKLAEAE